MTGAYKNLLLRLLCIGDPADDTDGHTAEAEPLLLAERTLDKFREAAAEANLTGEQIADVVRTATKVAPLTPTKCSSTSVLRCARPSTPRSTAPQ